MNLSTVEIARLTMNSEVFWEAHSFWVLQLQVSLHFCQTEQKPEV